MQGGAETELPSLVDAAVRRCAACCRETIGLYAGGPDPDPEFASTLLAVVAALELVLQGGAETRERMLAAAAEIARDGAATLRRYGLDEQILRCAAACEEAAYRCSAALDDPVSP